MPTIFESNAFSVILKNRAKITTLANPAILGTDALRLERIELNAADKTSLYEAVEAERFIYVIRGNGQANVGDQMFPLKEESVLWLEKEDSFSLEADSDGLELLLCQAPARV